MRSISLWFWATGAALFVVVVATVAAHLWISVGDTQISIIGWLSMGFGIVLTLAVGIGLMTLVFISNRRGYDEAAHYRREDC